MSHSGRHPITRKDNRCTTCGDPVVYVETEGGSRNRSHWRHKPQGYHWGARAARMRLALTFIADTTTDDAIKQIATTALREAR